MTKKEYKNFSWAKIAALMGIVAFALVIGWAGDIDYTEQCILRMSYAEYDTIKDSLTTQYGREPSEREIAHCWADNRK